MYPWNYCAQCLYILQGNFTTHPPNITKLRQQFWSCYLRAADRVYEASRHIFAPFRCGSLNLGMTDVNLMFKYADFVRRCRYFLLGYLLTYLWSEEYTWAIFPHVIGWLHMLKTPCACCVFLPTCYCASCFVPWYLPRPRFLSWLQVFVSIPTTSIPKRFC